MTAPTPIERVAVALCAEHGIDPTTQVVCGLQDTLTPREKVDRRGKPGPHNPSVHAAQWQLFRSDAARLLAGRAVLARYAVLEQAGVPEAGEGGSEAG